VTSLRSGADPGQLSGRIGQMIRPPALATGRQVSMGAVSPTHSPKAELSPAEYPNSR
jgi:hypothetical protein